MTSRQPHPLPVERGRGIARGPRGGRPAGDTIPHHECEVCGCGGQISTDDLEFELVMWTPQAFGSRRHFCSHGCLGRWAALQEIRS